MKKYLSFFILLSFLAAGNAKAQYNSPRNKVWAFGHRVGLDFNGPAPAFVNTSIHTGEGSASVCDENGSLLFYTDGTTVYNASGAVMPHGDTIFYGAFNTYSTTQAALIVPFPGNPQRYYVFSLFYKLYCSVVDMSLDNGNGDVDTTFSLTGIALADTLTEKMIAVPGCNNNIWVLLHANNNNHFKAYEITAAGLNTTPVVSAAGTFPMYSYYAGALKADPAGERLASFNTGAGVELYDFDKGTGIVSNAVVLDSTGTSYGGAFSPDGRKLYRDELGTGIYQYNLDAPNPAQSRLFLGTVIITDLRLAPDGKIYFNGVNPFSTGSLAYIGCIGNPNVAGAGCNFNLYAIPFTVILQQTELTIGLPNEVVTISTHGEGGSQNQVRVFDTVVCHFPYVAGIQLTAEGGYSHYLWDNGNTGTDRTIMQRGTYWVRCTRQCDTLTDTFKIKGTQPDLTLSLNNSVISTSGSYSSYQWYQGNTALAGATQSTLTINANGWYSVKVTDATGCTDSAAIEVTGYTGIATPDTAAGQLFVYPTVTQGPVYIFSGKAGQLKLTVSDVAGRVLSHSEGLMTDVGGLSNGVYFLLIEDQQSRLRRQFRIVKQ